MPRQPRLEFPGACFHVLNRGNYRRDLFALPGAARSFQITLFEACVRFGWRLHAFVIMRNHFHLALELTEANLSLGMKWLQGTWSMRFNGFHEQIGRPFQGRYKGIHVQPGQALAQVAHYIHLNPLRAGAVTSAQISESPHNSLSHFQNPNRPPFLIPSVILAESGGLTDTPDGWRRYIDFLLLLVTRDPQTREKLYQSRNHGWCVGGDEFRDDLRDRLLRQGHSLEACPRTATANEWRENREDHWARQLERAAGVLGLDLNRLPPAKSDPSKLQLAALVKATTSVSNGWLALRLGIGSPDNVSQYLRRFRLRGGDRHPAFQAALSEVST